MQHSCTLLEQITPSGATQLYPPHPPALCFKQITPSSATQLYRSEVLLLQAQGMSGQYSSIGV
jgi:hypothetical protein